MEITLNYSKTIVTLRERFKTGEFQENLKLMKEIEENKEDLKGDYQTIKFLATKAVDATGNDIIINDGWLDSLDFEDFLELDITCGDILTSFKERIEERTKK